MKLLQSVVVTALVLCTGLFATGCKKSSGTTGPGGGGTTGFGSGSISATVSTIGNMSFTGAGVWPPSGSGTVAIYDASQTYLAIIGYSHVSGSNFSLLVVGLYVGPGGIQTGTFAVNDTVGTGFLVGSDIDTNLVDSLGYFSATGSITVSAVSGTNVVGSFTGTAVRPLDQNSVNVNNGSFNVTYVNGRNPLEGAAGDRAKGGAVTRVGRRGGEDLSRR